MLVGVKVPQLHVGFGKRRIECDCFLQQRFDLLEIEARVFCPFAFPQTHGVIVLGPCVARLEFRKATKPLDDFVPLAGRAVIGSGEKKITTRISRIQIGSGRPGPMTAALQQRFFDVINGEVPDTHGWLTYVYPEESALREPPKAAAFKSR